MQVFSTKNLSQLPEKLLQLKNACPAPKAKPQDWHQWADNLETVWLDSFDLTHAAVMLSSEDTRAIENYLYITKLIVRCKESAVRVSKTEWEALESRLLTLKGYRT